MDEEDFLAAVEADNAAMPVEETPEEPKVEEPKAEPVADQPIEAPTLEEPPTPTEPAVTVEAPKPEPNFAPISALLDERDKRKKAEELLQQYQQRLQQQQPPEIPDPIEDQEGFVAYQAMQTQHAVMEAKLDMSEELARQAHGDETVSAAQQWAVDQFKANPAMHQQFLGQRNPYGYLVQQYQRQQAFEKLGNPSEIDAFLAWKQAQGALQQAAPAAPPNQVSASPPAPPRSLASAPSAGGVSTQVIQSDEEIFAETFDKKA